MPLIQCPDCGGKVSDSAPACPHCGRPNRGEPTTSTYLIEPRKRIYRSTYVILALFLGALGIHNFYARRIGHGWFAFLMTMLFCWTVFVPLIVWLMAFGECFSVKEDGYGNPMV